MPLVTTTRAVRDDIKNTLDYLMSAELALYANDVSFGPTEVTWHAHDRTAAFLLTHEHPTIDQYVAWINAGAYSAVLHDGSLLQIAYSVIDGNIAGHRLAYIPCPYDIDQRLLREGEPLGDVISLYRGTDAQLRSSIRIDFDPSAASPGHPATHMTINAPSCRIACTAPVHVLRFIDFVFRHFYPRLWRAHRTFFEAAAWRHAGTSTLVEDERRTLHMAWDHHATQGS
jgi:hypothetical protein